MVESDHDHNLEGAFYFRAREDDEPIEKKVPSLLEV